MPSPAAAVFSMIESISSEMGFALLFGLLLIVLFSDELGTNQQQGLATSDITSLIPNNVTHVFIFPISAQSASAAGVTCSWCLLWTSFALCHI